MGCDAPTCLKFLLFIFNLILTFLFLLLVIFGFLIRFSPRTVIAYMQQLLDEAVPEANAENLAKFFMENSLPIALTLIIVGICCALFCFLGALAACCGCRGLLKFHAAIFALLIIASSIATGVLFGTNESLQNAVDALMMRTLQGAYVDQTANSPGIYVWYLIMTKDNVTCCGMNGYTDFGSKTIPAPCCSASVSTMPTTCSAADAETQKIPGCKARINHFISQEKLILLSIPVIFIVIQVILFSLTVAALCVNSISPI